VLYEHCIAENFPALNEPQIVLTFNLYMLQPSTCACWELY